jgi:putative IMPACT (imprinted ancient) family translation regulator
MLLSLVWLLAPRFTLRSIQKSVYEVNKSKFIAFVGPVSSNDEAIEFIKSHSDPKASHNCYAFATGKEYCRFNDDGEPGGSAGRPILDALAGLTDVSCVVRRYYGGVKLGVGGLQRAYRTAAAMAVQDGERIEVKYLATVSLGCKAEQIGSLYRLLKAVSKESEYLVTKVEEKYNINGDVTVLVTFPSKSLDILEQKTSDFPMLQINIENVET